MDFVTLKSEIRDLVDDPDQPFTTEDYLKNKVNLKYRDLFNKLRLSGVQFDQQVVELPNIPPVNSSLQLFIAGQPLVLLLNSQVFEWKQAGLPATNYVEANLTARLRDV